MNVELIVNYDEKQTDIDVEKTYNENIVSNNGNAIKLHHKATKVYTFKLN